MKNNTHQRIKRHRRIRTKVIGNNSAPRLSVFRSNKHIYAQIIDDQKSSTVASMSDLNLKEQKDKMGKIQKAEMVGEKLAQKAKTQKINKIVFDRGGFKFHGRIKALAEGLRSGGLKF